MSEYWYPFFPSEYKKATRHLTAEQDGIYRRLIDEYMETREPLPDDDIALARISGVNEIKWLDAKRIVIAFFTHTNGTISHEFCDQQLDIQDKRSKRRSESAEKAAKKRWDKVKQIQQLKCDTHNNRNATRMRRNATDTDTDTSTDTDSKKDSFVFSRKTHESDFEEFWKSWTPYKTGKGSKADAKEIYLKIRKDTDHETLSKSSAEYCRFCETTDCNTKNVFRWLKKRGWEDDYTIPDKGNGASNNKASYSSQILAASKRAGEQLRIREERGCFGSGGNAPFDEGGETDHSLLPNPGDTGPDTIPFRPIGDAQEDGRE